MHPEKRAELSQKITQQSYESIVDQLNRDYPGQLDFRVGESPVLVPKYLGDKIQQACSEILETILADNFKVMVKDAVPAKWNVANQNSHTSFLAIDFAVCKDQKGAFVPQLIELQGFASLFGFQGYLGEAFKKQYQISDDFSQYFGDINSENYFEKFKNVILNGHQPEEVILLEVFPEKQKTRIDFAVTAERIGVLPVCLTKIIQKGNRLFYQKDGREIHIKRIYNRLIFDELDQNPDLVFDIDLKANLAVEWCGHPNWYYQISKYAMPFLISEYVPHTFFLKDLKLNAVKLEEYVLKPLFSFAGSGVVLNVTTEIIDSLDDPENYILQKKVKYEPVILSPTGFVKCEIRMLYIWPDDSPKPILFTNLARLSRGEMIGVRFNKDFDWVGGSMCFFEK